MNTKTVPSDSGAHDKSHSAVSRTLVLVYGVVAYFIGVAGLVYMIAAFAGIVPFGSFTSPLESTTAAVLWNVGLVFVWGLAHSGMARSGFKQKLTQLIPEPAERATYCLVAGVLSILMIGYWKVIPGSIWSVENGFLVTCIWILFGFGWVFLLASTFAINHFDLFGLRQVYLHFKDRPREHLTFVKRAMYRHIRHPIQTGVLIGIWAVPEMRINHFILSCCFTVYIFVGLWFEERDLIKKHGDAYRDYRNEAGKLFPKLFK